MLLLYTGGHYCNALSIYEVLVYHCCKDGRMRRNTVRNGMYRAAEVDRKSTKQALKEGKSNDR